MGQCGVEELWHNGAELKSTNNSSTKRLTPCSRNYMVPDPPGLFDDHVTQTGNPTRPTGCLGVFVFGSYSSCSVHFAFGLLHWMTVKLAF